MRHLTERVSATEVLWVLFGSRYLVRFSIDKLAAMIEVFHDFP